MTPEEAKAKYDKGIRRINFFWRLFEIAICLGLIALAIWLFITTKWTYATVIIVVIFAFGFGVLYSSFHKGQ